MEHKYRLTKNSNNGKTGGGVYVTTTSRSSCSSACPFKAEYDEDGNIIYKGCYADQFHMKMHWDKVSSGERGDTLEEFIKEVHDLPYRALVRHNQAGDLPGDGHRTLFRDECFKLAKAFKRVLAWTYTSYPLTAFNIETLKEMLRKGFVVNKSCYSLDQVDKAMDEGIPATVVLPSNTMKGKVSTPQGRTVARCPAELSKKINCGNCGGAKGPLCLRPDRDFAVGFVAHGIFKKKADAMLGGE